MGARIVYFDKFSLYDKVGDFFLISSNQPSKRKSLMLYGNGTPVS